jgi:hypothetical protein
MKTKVMVTFFLMVILFIGYYVYEMTNSLQEEKHILQNKIINIEEEARINNLNRDTMCQPNINGPQYVDCGGSFSPRWATCVCTTMCLEDYTITYSNRAISDCKNWNAPQKMKVEPEPGDEEGGEDGEEN